MNKKVKVLLALALLYFLPLGRVGQEPEEETEEKSFKEVGGEMNRAS